MYVPGTPESAPDPPLQDMAIFLILICWKSRWQQALDDLWQNCSPACFRRPQRVPFSKVGRVTVTQRPGPVRRPHEFGTIGYLQAVILTGALLAESASVVDNKLNVQGGVIDSFQADSGRLAAATLVVLIQPEGSERTATIDVTFTDPVGESNKFDLEIPPSSLGGEVGFVCYPVRIPVPTDGQYRLTVSAQTGTVTLPLNVFS